LSEVVELADTVMNACKGKDEGIGRGDRPGEGRSRREDGTWQTISIVFVKVNLKK
jgi:hypothetical protein